MPRLARTLSDTKIYHIMIRGNEKKNIFLDEHDKRRFIEILYSQRDKDAFRLYAYCIMNNHVHLVMKEENQSISQTMKSIGIGYALYFNKKYDRVGHVFQDRFRSQNIDSESYLLAAVRYVHNNPVKANYESGRHYKWSSFDSYYYGNATYLVDIEEIIGSFSEDLLMARKRFIDFSLDTGTGSESFIDMEEIPENKINRENVGDYIYSYLSKCKVMLSELNRKDNTEIRDNLIRDLIQESSLSMRMIADITGVNREKVRRISGLSK